MGDVATPAAYALERGACSASQMSVNVVALLRPRTYSSPSRFNFLNSSP